MQHSLNCLKRHWVLFELVDANKKTKVLRFRSKVLDSTAPSRNVPKHANHGFEVFTKGIGDRLIAKSIRSIIPILVAVLKPCEPLLIKRQLFHDFPGL